MDLQYDRSTALQEETKFRARTLVAEKKPEALSVGGMKGRSVVRSPEGLQVHPALRELDGFEVAVELNEAERVRHHATMPILITSDGIILSGFGQWRSALLRGENELECIEYTLGEEESIQFILIYQRPRRGWNAFVRTRLALKLERHLQCRALDNMRAGGRYKGSAKLPDPQHLDVRRQISEIAGVGARNVSNVKFILRDAHPRLLTALANGTLTINKALMLCKLPREQQLEAFTQLIEEQAVDKVIRNTLARGPQREVALNAAAVLAAFQVCESSYPGSLVVKRGSNGRTMISIPNRLLKKIDPQMEFQQHETAQSTQRRTASDSSPLGPA